MKNNVKRREFISPQIVIFFFVVAFMLSFAGYQFWRWQSMTIYLDKVDEVQMKANTSIAEYNKMFMLFKGDPESAKKLEPKFTEAEKAINKVAKDLAAINPPGSAGEYHKDLIELYNASAKFYGDLGLLADYVVKRNAILEHFAKDTEVFGQRIEAGQTDADVISASRDLKESADKALQDLGDLKKPYLAVYSNRVLQKNLTLVSSALTDIEEGLNSNDVYKIKQAAAALQAVFDQDWGPALFEGDGEGLKEVEVRSKELQDLQTNVALERSAL